MLSLSNHTTAAFVKAEYSFALTYYNPRCRWEVVGQKIRSEAATRLRDYFHPTGRLTQAEVAVALGVTQQAVSMWVTGRSRPAPHLREALERVTGIAVHSWLTKEELGSAGAAARRLDSTGKVA